MQLEIEERKDMKWEWEWENWREWELEWERKWVLYSCTFSSFGFDHSKGSSFGSLSLSSIEWNPFYHSLFLSLSLYLSSVVISPNYQLSFQMQMQLFKEVSQDTSWDESRIDRRTIHSFDTIPSVLPFSVLPSSVLVSEIRWWENSLSPCYDSQKEERNKEIKGSD